MNYNEQLDLLEYFYDKYNRADFIEADPISVPHQFSLQEDIEISGFLAATIAWGNRKAIVKNAHRMIQLMGKSPYDFVLSASDNEIQRLAVFVHRTFNGNDFIDFVYALRKLYKIHGNLGIYFETTYAKTNDMRKVLSLFRHEFLKENHHAHCEKHLSNIDKGAACKRLNMYLRWMVRRDNRGVDFGLWKQIPASAIYLPLDVHSGTVGRTLNLLTRHQNDWKAVEEITSTLRMFDPSDPVRFDFALFGAGMDGKI